MAFFYPYDDDHAECDGDPWCPGIVDDESAPEWRDTHTAIDYVHEPVAGGDAACLFDPDPSYMHNRWIISDAWVSVPAYR